MMNLYCQIIKPILLKSGKERELIDKYKKQLDLYKNALEEALKRKVSKTYIYSTYLGKEIYVNYEY